MVTSPSTHGVPSGIAAHAGDRLVLADRFLGHLADDLLDDVLQRDQALQRAVLVDHQGEMVARLAERLQLLLQRRSFRG